MKKIIALLLAVLLTVSIAACSSRPEIASAAPSDNSGNAGKTSSDPHGRSSYDAVIARNDVTLVTVLATWSTPCETMISTLQQVSESMKRVGVVAIISDAVDEETLAVDEETMTYAKELLTAKNADFTIIAPDQDLFVTFCSSTEFYPTSYIVDHSGNIIAAPLIAAADADTISEALNAALESLSNAD